MLVRQIQVGDEVKNINGNSISGRVIAKFTLIENGLTTTYVDIRAEERIYYKSPISNWETVIPVGDLE